jgi:fluoride exporter
MVSRLLLICLAGALGTGTRYLIGVWASERWGSAFPYGTLVVNVLGCFLMGAVLETALSTGASANLRLTLTTGFLGGLTTYSAFASETVSLARSGARSAALANFAVTSVACVLAVVLGIMLARLWCPSAAGE